MQFLHVGCGSQKQIELKGFNSLEWEEIRFDIDEKIKPDIVGTLTDMSKVMNESVDAVYSSHNIEHIYAHEVPIALKEFFRVLKPEGFVVITCPDLKTVCEAIIKDQLLQPLYRSPTGDIAPIDILYGHRLYLMQGKEFMSHKCGFTYQSLCSAFYEAGFKTTFGGSRPNYYDLWLIAFKNLKTHEEIGKVAPIFLP